MSDHRRNTQRKDPQLDAWDRLLNRIERTLVEAESREQTHRKGLMAGVSGLSRNDTEDLTRRFLSYAPKGLVFADEGRESELTRVYRKMTVFNPLPSRFGAWEEGKTRNFPISRIIEDPVFKASHQSFFIQLADCVSYALLKRETAPTPNIARYGIHQMFDECLGSVCHKAASPRDPFGIVRK